MNRAGNATQQANSDQQQAQYSSLWRIADTKTRAAVAARDGSCCVYDMCKRMCFAVPDRPRFGRVDRGSRRQRLDPQAILQRGNCVSRLVELLLARARLIAPSLRARFWLASREQTRHRFILSVGAGLTLPASVGGKTTGLAENM